MRQLETVKTCKVRLPVLPADVRDAFQRSFEHAAGDRNALFNDAVLLFSPYYFAARAYRHFKASPDACIGCGNGAFTELLVERCGPVKVQGIDPSEGQLALRAHGRRRGWQSFNRVTRWPFRSPQAGSTQP